ncbi:hypothetical protein ACXWSA_09725, partial [Streptococcus pyogenes]
MKTLRYSFLPSPSLLSFLLPSLPLFFLSSPLFFLPPLFPLFPFFFFSLPSSPFLPPSLLLPFFLSFSPLFFPFLLL